jgi:hypothetical protein
MIQANRWSTAREERMDQMPETEDKDALLKEASLHLRKAHRRVEAEKLAFALVEHGKIPAFSSYDGFQEKVGEILSKDLAVVREALAMDSPIADFGKVAEERGAGEGADSATAAFYHLLAE